MKTKNQNGFSLIEVMIGTAVIVLFVLGIYSSIQFVFKVVYQSRLRIIETGILNEQVEIIRNLPFEKVGIINGSPSGILTRTAVISRNGVDFVVTRTIRNIDDPFDGTIDGLPKDLSPADYKLVQLEVICSACEQKEPVKFTTYIAPKYLEGDPTHGALFIQVFDSIGKPVQGADVHIVASSTNPTINMTDTTDNEGMLRIVDLGAGISAYNITTSKSGYTADQTIAPSEFNPNPVKPPASVVAQNVTEISFSIDKVSSLALSTINNVCQPVGNVPVNLIGAKVWGTEPDILKVNQNVNTDSSGNYTFSNLEWDNYGLRVSGYDLIGSIPALPIVLPAGIEQPVQVLVGASTANSLVVNVQDSITGQPVSNANVRVIASGYDKTKLTGIGFARQTDWSGGSGQLQMVNESKYWSDDGKVDTVISSGDIKLRKVGSQYASDGQLESSIFDLGTAVNFVNLNWEPFGQPTETGDSVKWQLATSNTSTPAAWDYRGPDGTIQTFYNPSSIAINSVHNGDRYVRYQLYLTTASTTYTPTISDVNISYTTSCTPPGQAYFGGLSGQEYTVEVSKTGYQTVTEKITPSGDMILAVNMTTI